MPYQSASARPPATSCLAKDQESTAAWLSTLQHRSLTCLQVHMPNAASDPRVSDRSLRRKTASGDLREARAQRFECPPLHQYRGLASEQFMLGGASQCQCVAGGAPDHQPGLPASWHQRFEVSTMVPADRRARKTLAPRACSRNDEAGPCARRPQQRLRPRAGGDHRGRPAPRAARLPPRRRPAPDWRWHSRYLPPRDKP